MPLLKHAKKKQRQDIKRELEHKKLKTIYKQLMKKAKENPSQESVSAAFKAIDKAAKLNLMHDNKAARLKSSIAKAASGTPLQQAPAPKKHLTKAAQAKANKTKSTKSDASEAVAKKEQVKATPKKKSSAKNK